VERLARRLFAGGNIERIVALNMPKSRFIIWTPCSPRSRRTRSTYAGMGMLPAYVEPGARTGAQVHRPPARGHAHRDRPPWVCPASTC
jgi:arginine deiminase